MRLLTHNTMRNNTKEAEGRGFPLKITAVEVKVVKNPDAAAVGEKEIQFVRHMLPILEWAALVQVCTKKKERFDSDTYIHIIYIYLYFIDRTCNTLQ
jgi:hypothetical protein